MKAMATLVVWCLVSSIAACGDGLPPRVGGAGGGAGEAVAPAKAAVLAIEGRRPGAKPFPFAIVDGTIGGRPAKLVVDTGAATHAIDRAFGADGSARLSVAGWGDVPARAAEIVDLSPSMKAHGVGGVVAPQLLAEGGQAVVVDLVNKQMRLRPKATAWSELEDIGAVLTGPQGARVCPAESGGVPGALLAIDASVEGAPVKLAIDTGASRTTLIEGSAAGAKAAAHALLGRSMAPSVRADTATPLHGGVPLAASAWSTTVDLGTVPGERHAACGHEGRLGLDVLQYCAVAITADEMRVACRAPGQ